MTMPNVWSLLETSTVELVGWTLLHLVWQGALVAAMLAGALFLLQNYAPRIRYVLSCVALFGLLALPVGTGIYLHEGSTAAEEAASAVVTETTERPILSRFSTVPDATPRTTTWQARTTARIQSLLPWIVVGWALGVIVFSIRLTGGAWRVRRLRRTSTPAPSEWQDRVRTLAERMGLYRTVALRQSDHVGSPVVAGWWRPVLLVPAGLLSGLPPRQVEALLLHELAHVQRHDVLIGRLQAVVETLLFFHPATWWISRQVRQTREACCDALTVQTGANRTVYAHALMALAERAVAGTSSAWALGATDGSLLARIERLLSPPPVSSRSGRYLSIAAAVLLLVGVPLGLAACASQQPATEAETEETTTTVEVEEEGSAEGETVTPPDEPSEDVEEKTMVVVGDDSTDRAVRLDSVERVEVDSLREGVPVIRAGGQVDTVDLPELRDDLPFSFDADSLERALRIQINPDSLERVIQGRINPDSLERVIQARINPDSLERVIRMRFNRDSMEHRALRMQLRADSLGHWHREHADSLRRHFEQMREQMEREMPERLREQARRLREQADRLEERAEEMDVPAPGDTSDASGDSGENRDPTVRELEPTDRGTRYEVVRGTDRDTLLVHVSGRIVNEEEGASTGRPVFEMSTMRNEERTAFTSVLRRAQTSDTFEERARALESLADSYGDRPTVRRLFRTRALDSTATDLERWKAISGLAGSEGSKAKRTLQYVQATAANPELQTVAGWVLDRHGE